MILHVELGFSALCTFYLSPPIDYIDIVFWYLLISRLRRGTTSKGARYTIFFVYVDILGYYIRLVGLDRMKAV